MKIFHSPTQAANLLFDYYLGNKFKENPRERMSINLLGHAGIGKTACVYQAAEKITEYENSQEGRKDRFRKTVKSKEKELNRKLTSEELSKIEKDVNIPVTCSVKYINLSSFSDGTDLLGLPVKGFEYKGKFIPEMFKDRISFEELDQCVQLTTYARPDWWPNSDSEHVILLLDDSGRAFSTLQQTVMELNYHYSMNGLDLPQNVFVVLTNNPSNGDYSTKSLDSAQERRTVNINVGFQCLGREVKTNDGIVWEGGFIDYLSNKGYNNQFIEFLTDRADEFKDYREEGNERQNSNIFEMPANVERFLMVVKDVLQIENFDLKNKNHHDGIVKHGSFFFGEKSQLITAFIGYLSNRNYSIPTVDEILNAPMKKLVDMCRPYRNNRPALMSLITTRMINTFVSEEGLKRTAEGNLHYLNRLLEFIPESDSDNAFLFVNHRYRLIQELTRHEPSNFAWRNAIFQSRAGAQIINKLMTGELNQKFS